MQEERGRSITVGAVIEPRWIPGLELTVDYYNIRVKSLIAAPSLAGLLSLCFDSALPFASNPFCNVTAASPTALFPRVTSGLFADNFGGFAAQVGGINFAKQTTRGLDFDINYRKTFDNGDKIRLSLIATRVLERIDYANPALPQEPNRILSELGDPKWAASFLFDYDFGDFDVRYGVRYIGKQTIGTYEAQNAYEGLCPASGQTGISGRTCTPGQLATLAPQNADQFPRVYYPDVFYHDIRIGFDVNKKFRFYAGVSNLFDRQPPLGLLGTAGGDPFDSFGRNFFAGITANF